MRVPTHHMLIKVQVRRDTHLGILLFCYGHKARRGFFDDFFEAATETQLVPASAGVSAQQLYNLFFLCWFRTLRTVREKPKS